MGWFDWIWNLFVWRTKAKILFLGLDNAGKTTLLHVLSKHRLTISSPTTHASSEELRVGNVRFRAFDLGGHIQARRYWHDYFPEVNGIVFMIDVADKNRLGESRKELQKLMYDPQLDGVPILILGNKIDAEGAIGEDELREFIGIPHGSILANSMRVCMCSVVHNQGFYDGFEWLGKCI